MTPTEIIKMTPTEIIKPIITYLVTLPNGYSVSCKDITSAETLCAYFNGLNAPTEPKKDGPDTDYDRVVGSLVTQMPGGSTLTHNNSGGWRYRDADGAEYGPYVDVHNALDILSK